MDNNEVDMNGTGGQKSAPKPLRKLVKVNRENKDTFQNYPPVNEEYHGRYEASPQEYHGQHEAPAGEYRGQHEAPAPYVGRYGADNDGYDGYDDEYEYEEEHTRRRFSLKDFITKFVAVAVSIVLIVGLVINVPIFADKKTGGNISLVNLIKSAQPMAKEGLLNKENVTLNIDTEKVEEDYNDGLDLPQLIEGQYSILFLGFDEDEFNSDVMWIVQFDIGHSEMNILQIPRDCCLPDYTSSPARKFNSVYSMGDYSVNPPIQRVVNAVQENFGIPIDAYITTACFDIVRMVDIVGGIPIHLDNEIIYESDKIIPAGDITLTGEQAEWFIRFRTEWLQGDIGRMQNQRRFMAATMMKLFDIVENEGRLKLYSYIKQIKDEDLIYTDLSIGDMSKIADFASTLSMDSVRVNMVPGEEATFYAEDGEEYAVYSVHKAETIALLNQYYRPYQTAMTPYDTSIVELVLDHKYDVYDDTGIDFEELETATEPLRDPDKKPWWKED
ncbi:MAG: LCP family protein [Ruminococcus sp.]|nr:LCP family protein [Ruminococcus sp.]